jgi:hypothetical protein
MSGLRDFRVYASDEANPYSNKVEYVGTFRKFIQEFTLTLDFTKADGEFSRVKLLENRISPAQIFLIHQFKSTLV